MEGERSHHCANPASRKSLTFLFLMKEEKALDKILSKKILKSRHLYYEVRKLSKNFTEGNARKISVVLLHWLLCDVIKSQNDHARMRTNGPLASLSRLREIRIVLISSVLSYHKATLAILRLIFGDENLE